MERREQLDTLRRGYIDTLVHTGTIVTTNDEVLSLEDFAGLSQEAMLSRLAFRLGFNENVRAAVTEFYRKQASTLNAVVDRYPDADMWSLGSDLALEHLGLGCGFADRGYGQLSQILEQAAQRVHADTEFWEETDNEGLTWLNGDVTYYTTGGGDDA